MSPRSNIVLHPEINEYEKASHFLGTEKWEAIRLLIVQWLHDL